MKSFYVSLNEDKKAGSQSRLAHPRNTLHNLLTKVFSRNRMTLTRVVCWFRTWGVSSSKSKEEERWMSEPDTAGRKVSIFSQKTRPRWRSHTHFLGRHDPTLIDMQLDNVQNTLKFCVTQEILSFFQIWYRGHYTFSTKSSRAQELGAAQYYIIIIGGYIPM